MAKLVIDPITRIEGHLKIEVEVEGGKVKDAKSHGTLFRGFEIILKGEILEMHPRLHNEFVGSARQPMELHLFDVWTMLLK